MTDRRTLGEIITAARTNAPADESELRDALATLDVILDNIRLTPEQAGIVGEAFELPPEWLEADPWFSECQHILDKVNGR